MPVSFASAVATMMITHQKAVAAAAAPGSVHRLADQFDQDLHPFKKRIRKTDTEIMTTWMDIITIIIIIITIHRLIIIKSLIIHMLKPKVMLFKTKRERKEGDGRTNGLMREKSERIIRRGWKEEKNNFHKIGSADGLSEWRNQSTHTKII